MNTSVVSGLERKKKYYGYEKKVLVQGKWIRTWGWCLCVHGVGVSVQNQTVENVGHSVDNEGQWAETDVKPDHEKSLARN